MEKDIKIEEKELNEETLKSQDEMLRQSLIDSKDENVFAVSAFWFFKDELEKFEDFMIAFNGFLKSYDVGFGGHIQLISEKGETLTESELDFIFKEE